jgi:3-oxoacyl-[acyl-carrier protein] reductase
MPEAAGVSHGGDGLRVVVLTGAAGNLGAALARGLAAEPDTALVLGDLDASGLGELVAKVERAGTPAIARAADVSRAEDVDSLAAAAVEEYGRLDAIINNAGVISPNGRIHNLSDADWMRCIQVNLMGAVHGIASAVRVMRPAGGGSIVNTASVAGMTAWPYAGPYGASKAAVIQLTKIAAAEYARDGIRVNCVCPGTFVSAMHEELPAEAIEAIADKHPLGLGDAEDLVGAFLYLVGPASRWTTGSALVVDGGYSAV